MRKNNASSVSVMNNRAARYAMENSEEEHVNDLESMGGASHRYLELPPPVTNMMKKTESEDE